MTVSCQVCASSSLWVVPADFAAYCKSYEDAKPVISSGDAAAFNSESSALKKAKIQP